MRKLIVAIALMAACTFKIKAQNCPAASFQIPDSICSGTSVPFTNNSSGGIGSLSYDWDFCSGDLKRDPVYDTIGDFGTFAKFTAGIDLVYDSGNWYGFALNAANYSITRYDFGNSLRNMPTAVDIGNFGGGNFLDDIAIIKDNNQWYAFICVYQNLLFRVDFGANITNPNPPATFLNISPGYLTNPYVLKLVRDHNRFKILVANSGSSSISLIDIGTQITNNNPSIVNLPNTFPDIFGITVAKDCDHWYGFTVSQINSSVTVIDFGDSITSTPLSVNNMVLQGPQNSSYEIEVLNDGAKWYGFLMGSTLKRINFGSSLNVLNAQIDNLPIAFDPSEHYFSIKKSGSEWIGITTYTAFNANPDLGRFVFPNDCKSNSDGSADANPSGVSFSGSGYHQISLQVTDSNENTSFYTDSIYTKNAPETYFSHSNACIGSPVNFSDSSVIIGETITSWNWGFGDSNISSAQNPSHLYSITGDYVVMLQTTSSNGCIGTYSDTVSVRSLPAASFSFSDNPCTQTDVFFTDSSTSAQDPIATWNWNFGDSTNSSQTNPHHSYLTGGDYLIELTVITSKGCSSTFSDSIHIRPRPVSDFSVVNTCIGETVSFINQSTISDSSVITYSWDLDDFATSNLTHPVHQYPATIAVYNVVLIANATNGCSDTITKPVQIGNKPIPAFTITPSIVCKGNNVNFSDLSTVPGGGIGDTISHWLWNFGDTITSNQQNPTHIYSDTGTYSVTLTVMSPTACDSAVSQVIHVIDAPVAAFNYSDVCFGLTNNFIDFSTPPAGSVIISRSWDFGDSTTASGSSVSHAYTSPGTYYVTLTVVDTFGCTDFVMHPVTVYPLPVASFTNSLACTNATVNFSNASTISASDTIVSFLWDFGDGSGFSSLVNPTHVYTTFGSETATLIAMSSNGCADTFYMPFFVHQSPSPGFTYSHTCQGEATQFTYISSTFPPTITTYLWSFGDLGTSQDSNPLHTYANAITYNATVFVIDNTGCSATITLPVTVNPVPSANFSYSSGCTGMETTFADSSTLVSGHITTYNWNFGNGNISASAAPVFIFDSAGTYPVTLKVISNAGCSDSISKLISIVDLPIAAFTMSSNIGAPPHSVTFNNTSLKATSFLWSFGDGFTSNTINPVHVYTDTGNFTITLIAFNAEGCSDTATHSILILIPFTDLAVFSVNTVRQNGLLSISAELFNLGNIVINNFEIVAQLEGGTIIHENYTKPVLPGLLKYTFSSTFETNSYTNPAYICVETRKPNGYPDQVPSNDKKCVSTGNSFEIIDIYCNPANEQAIIHFNVPVSGTVTIKIYDLTAKKMSEDISIQALKGFNSYTFDARTLTKGIYSCFMEYHEEKKIKRLLKF